MNSTYSVVPVSELYAPQVHLPDLYILSVGDLVDDFVSRWDDIINQEIINQPFKEDTVYPEVYSIASDGSIHKTVYLAQHVSEATRWHPDISMIIAAAFDAIKTKSEAQYDLDIVLGMLWIDIIHMATIQLMSNVPSSSLHAAVSNTRRQIADLSVQFGKQLYQRLIEYGLYKNGYFPYHYAGWQGNCVVVALDTVIPNANG